MFACSIDHKRADLAGSSSNDTCKINVRYHLPRENEFARWVPLSSINIPFVRHNLIFNKKKIIFFPNFRSSNPSDWNLAATRNLAKRKEKKEKNGRKKACNNAFDFAYVLGWRTAITYGAQQHVKVAYKYSRVAFSTTNRTLHHCSNVTLATLNMHRSLPLHTRAWSCWHACRSR